MEKTQKTSLKNRKPRQKTKFDPNFAKVDLKANLKKKMKKGAVRKTQRVPAKLAERFLCLLFKIMGLLPYLYKHKKVSV